MPQLWAIQGDKVLKAATVVCRPGQVSDPIELGNARKIRCRAAEVGGFVVEASPDASLHSGDPRIVPASEACVTNWTAFPSMATVDGNAGAYMPAPENAKLVLFPLLPSNSKWVRLNCSNVYAGMPVSLEVLNW